MAGEQGNIRSFIAPLKGSGRTAPAFLGDLTLYEPWRTSADLPNLLADSPLLFTNARFLGDFVPVHSCRHKFGVKPRQSSPPVLDERPDRETIWTVAALCSVCRLHLHVKVDYTMGVGDGPCPNTAHPLHHLVRSFVQEPLERNAWLHQNPGSEDEIFVYRCSSTTCSAAVTVRLSQPVLRPIDVQTLVDPTLIQRRTEEAFRERQGHTEGMKYPGPVDVLTDLRAYIRNSWKAQDDPKYRSINLSNRRFIVRFGPDGTACQDVLKHIGFQLVPGECWQVPEPDHDDSQPFQGPRNIGLDNVEHELLALLMSRPYEERQQIPEASPAVPAEREMARVLGCQDYDTHPSSRAAKSAPEMRTAPFTALGIPMDVSDALVIKAYHWQISTDMPSAPAYLSNLRYIASARQSELLETEVVFETSKGRFDIETLGNAYKAFQLSGREGTVNDEDIIGSFNATLADAPSHEHELREYLRIIGVHRNSKRLQDAAQNIIDSYEQALAFLDADPSIEDEHIQALFTVKVSENRKLEEQAILAVRLIARHRQSRFLSSWIDSGFSSDTHMDAAEGYQALQIDNREIDDEMIIYQYNMAVEENPNSVEFYNKAFAAIANGRQSAVLLDHLHSRAPEAPRGTTEEPVGLENIGNTCYLNSLLQFLFTVTELRQVVLNFDDYRMSLDATSMEQKRVGQRMVSLREVQTAQKFVDALQALFRGMIETPQSSIKPEQELARLTLETESVKEKMRRRSTLRSDRPSLGITDIAPLGPLLRSGSENFPPNDDAILLSPVDGTTAPGFDGDCQGARRDEEREAQDEMAQDDLTMHDNSSEATLVSKPGSEDAGIYDAVREEQQFILDDKENQSPSKIDAAVQPHSPKAGQPLAPASPSRVNAQAGAVSLAGVSCDPVPKPEDLMKYQPPPGKPPPVPPRKPVDDRTTTLEEYARQQDVTEVMNHCIIQLSCAIRPTAHDASGEQQDEIHNLFFGQHRVHVESEEKMPPPIPFLNIITRVYHQPTDVYAAIDNEFDSQDIQGGKKAYTSASSLPPVLSIALDRVSWNAEAKRQEKLNHHVDVPETIYMDRYLESADDSDLMLRRRQTWNVKKEIAALTARRRVLEASHGQSQNLPRLLEDAKMALQHLAEAPEDAISGSLDINPSTIATIGSLAEKARTELDAIRARSDHLTQQVREAFADMRKHPYRLHAAFFHRGSAGGGHYWVYIFDHRKEVWRKYNDDRVSVVQNRNEIFGKPVQESWGPPPNPYLLIYIRADRVDELVETVVRDIAHPISTNPPTPPARPTNQMSAMPPSHGSKEVEMTEYVNEIGEQVQNSTGPSDPYPYDLDITPSQPPASTHKQAEWDDSELVMDRKVQW